MRIVLTGYFERGNLGDDAMRDGLVHYLRTRHSECDVRQVPLPSFSLSGLRKLGPFVRLLRRADVMLLNGGTYFHDGLGRRSYRILLSFVVIFVIARLSGVSIACAGIGVGPLRRPVPRALSRLALSLCSIVLVRDRESAATLTRLGARTSVVEGFDTAVLLARPDTSQAKRGSAVGVSLVPYFTNYYQRPDIDEQVVEALIAALVGLRDHDPDLAVRVYAFHTGAGESDLTLSTMLAERLSAYVPTALVECRSPRQVLEEFSALRALLATRYHALMLGYLAQVPVVAVQYDQKCVSLAEQIGLSDDVRLLPQDLLSRARIESALAGLLQQEYLIPLLDGDEAESRALQGLDQMMALITNPQQSR
jgi:polysaccharide pyruvyl transferase WcaK-like protein